MKKPVLILGAASDMGTAIAEKFAAEGYPLLLAARKVQRLTPLQSDIAIRYAVSCTLLEFDVTAFATHKDFWQSITDKPTIFISVVGYMKDNDLVIASQQETLTTIETNYTGLVSILNIVAADFAAKQEGVIAGISSVAGLRGRQSNYIYGSAKAGFTAYLSGLRNKMYPHKVHVLTVLPGFVYTKMTEELNLPKLLTAQPKDVANTIYTAIQKRKNTVYVKWFWRWIMLIITSIPEFIFKTKKL